MDHRGISSERHECRQLGHGHGPVDDPAIDLFVSPNAGPVGGGTLVTIAGVTSRPELR